MILITSNNFINFFYLYYLKNNLLIYYFNYLFSILIKLIYLNNNFNIINKLNIYFYKNKLNLIIKWVDHSHTKKKSLN